MDEAVIRYCPACGARVKAPESAFEGPCVCPTCHERSQFYDYPREIPATTPKPAARPSTTLYDRLLVGAMVVAGLAALIVLWTLYEGRANAALIGSGVCLFAALALGGHIVRLKRDLLRAAEAQRRAERALVVSNSKLKASSEIHQGFKKNYDALVAEEKRRLEAMIAAKRERTEILHAEAVEQSKIFEARDPGTQVLGDQLLEATLDQISRHVHAGNVDACKDKLLDMMRFCRGNGCTVNSEREEKLLSALEENCPRTMLEEDPKDERQDIKEKMQEEDRVVRELEQSIRNAEAERSAVQKTLANVLQKSQGEDSEEVEYLRERLDAAEKEASEAENALEQPTSGYVYVLSNVGSFGQNVFKIGTTRQLDPRQHVTELSGPAVPFPYDIHMMIACEDTTALESALHEALHECRVNRLNHCKNFFRTDIQTIWRLVVATHGTVDYVSEAAAEQFEESRNMSDAAFKRITEMHKVPDKYRDPFSSKD